MRPGAADRILRDLEAFGLEWDDAVLHQSSRLEAYQSAFEQLERAGLLYPCACSRKDVGERYSGTCRRGLSTGQPVRSWRLRVADDFSIEAVDRIQGRIAQNVQDAIGDFIVRRVDAPFSYQLAVVMDDAAQGVTHVVRGADLFDNVPRQIYLGECLNLPALQYAHVPVVADNSGRKLSKSLGSAALNTKSPTDDLIRALRFLGHSPPHEYRGADVQSVMGWARANWSLRRVPRLLSQNSGERAES